MWLLLRGIVGAKPHHAEEGAEFGSSGGCGIGGHDGKILLLRILRARPQLYRAGVLGTWDPAATGSDSITDSNTTTRRREGSIETSPYASGAVVRGDAGVVAAGGERNGDAGVDVADPPMLVKGLSMKYGTGG
jgi:hypothetical protein